MQDRGRELLGSNLFQTLHQLRRQLRDTGRITETKFSAKTEGENLIVLMQAECLEQIGLPMQVQAEESN